VSTNWGTGAWTAAALQREGDWKREALSPLPRQHVEDPRRLSRLSSFPLFLGGLTQNTS